MKSNLPLIIGSVLVLGLVLYFFVLKKKKVVVPVAPAPMAPVAPANPLAQVATAVAGAQQTAGAVAQLV